MDPLVIGGLSVAILIGLFGIGMEIRHRIAMRRFKNRNGR